MTAAALLGMTPATFLRRHWQKKPLLVRQAIPGFAGLVNDPAALFSFAREPGAVARVVRERRGRYHVDDAALVDERALRGHWTVLLQGAEGFVDGAWELLSRFAFLPLARVDDLMISYASDGGGVGPHEDLYDVFLLQGPGKRRWQIEEGGARVFDETQPTRILTSFSPTDEWILEAGDMLYLPPGVGHCGTAVDGPCFTYSIGFLAPSHESLVHNWLAYLGQTLALEGLYGDPGLAPTRDPLEIPAPMVRAVDALLARTLRAARGHGAVDEFLGRLLTGPKPNVVLEAPRRPLSRPAFGRRLPKATLALARKSRGLARGELLFLNGEALRVRSTRARRAIATLLRERRASAAAVAGDEDAVDWLYGAYRAGGLVVL